jgi:hypothetical protein
MTIKQSKPALTAAERTAKVLRDNRNSPFCYRIATSADSDKTARIQGKPLRG